MLGLVIGQIVGNAGPSYPWLPSAIVGWAVVAGVATLWPGTARPDTLKTVGSVLATGAVNEANLTETFAEA